MSDAPVPISIPGSSSHARSAPSGSSASAAAKGKARAGAGNADGSEKKRKKFRHRKTKEELEFEREGKRLAAGGDGGLGVNKLKASLRQAKRLLNKEGLPADVKTETERKVKSLEAELEKAMGRNEEKKNATKYHMVKFFERKKLLRRLRPLLTKLNSTEAESLSSKKRAKLEAEVEGLRVGLNYVLNYPNSLKYISLFPPSATEAEDGAESDEGEKKPSPILTLPKDAGTSDTKRFELVEKVRGMMASGELSKKPEEDLQAGDDESGKKRKRIEVDDGKTKKRKGGEGAASSALAEDDFFGGDDSESD